MKAFGEFLIALSAVAFAGMAHAEEPSACMTPVAVDATLVRDAGANGFAALPNGMLAGALSATREMPEDADPIHGAVLFSRSASGAWRAAMPMESEDLVAAFARADGATILVTMMQTEGPGPSWTLMRVNAAGEAANCVTVHFPATLNQPEWRSEFLDLTDLDIDARGRGEIIGVAHTDAHGDLWFVYRTRDGGATWSAPRRLSRERAARAGEYAKVGESEAPAAVIAELQAYAASPSLIPDSAQR